MKIAIYSRKSKFTDKGESTQNQIDLCKEYAHKHFSVDDIIIYEDEGFSGGNVDRPEYQRMIKDAKKGKFNVLICYRLDRISRNIADFSDIIETLQENDISFVSLREQFDTSTPMGRAMMYIASVFAQLERETIAERIRDNMLQLSRTGRWLGGRTPTGFKSEPITYYDEAMNKKKMYKLTAIPGELKTVKTLFNKYKELDSLSQLESWCLENDMRSKNGKYFDKSALRCILSNPVYAVADEVLYEYFKNNSAVIASEKEEFNGKHGILVYNKNIEKKGRANKRRSISEWIVAVSKHKGVIPSIDWIQVQYMLEKNSLKAPRVGTSTYGLITPLLRCKKCGSKMRVTSKRANGAMKHYYYKCLLKERSRGSKCKVPNIIGKTADQAVVEELKNLSMPESSFFKELSSKKSTIQAISKSQETHRMELEKQLKECEKAISNLTTQLAQNESSAAAKYIIRQIEETDRKIAETKSKLDTITAQREESLIEKKNIEMIQELLKSFANTVDTLEFREKKKLIKTIVKEITWDGTRLEINVYGSDKKRKV